MSASPTSTNTTPRTTTVGLPSVPASAPLSVTPKSSTASGEGTGPHSSSTGAGAGVAAGEKNKGADGALLTIEGAGQAVSSPAELMTFVDTMLAQLEDKFNESSTEVLERMTTMSTRIDSLEMAISEIINGEIMPPINGAA